MRAIVVAAVASTVVAAVLEVALFIGARRLESAAPQDPGAGIALAGYTILVFVLIVPLTAGIAGGLAAREAQAVVGSVAGLFAASLLGLVLAGGPWDVLAMLRVVPGLAALSLLTVMGHVLAMTIRPRAVLG